jgi:hypothetical protein
VVDRHADQMWVFPQPTFDEGDWRESFVLSLARGVALGMAPPEEAANDSAPAADAAGRQALDRYREAVANGWV